mmetsp:Transcript_4396/g.6166  ORF Transcript_4396/g.6166 Transcript_4396/m.6166 type:complete len:367 (+) Transcript_4396:21-1121(+)
MDTNQNNNHSETPQKFDEETPEQQSEGKQVWKDAYWKYCKNEDKKEVLVTVTEGPVENSADDVIRTDVSWKEVEWDTAREAVAKQLLDLETKLVSPEQRDDYEKNAGQYWEKFYSRNENKFFKDRHYLHFQFDILKLDKDTGESKIKNMKVMEVGCGTGCTLFPLLEAHKDTTFYVFDFSAKAVQLVQKNPLFETSRCKAFVCDVVTQELPSFIERESLDMILMIFVLSAIKPSDMRSVLEKLHRSMKVGGRFLLRDYGVYDLTQMRFLYKEGRKLDTNYYVRADGTTVFYFTIEDLTDLFGECGFKVEKLGYDTRELRNRKKQINMYRNWVNGTFVKMSPEEHQQWLEQKQSNSNNNQAANQNDS